VIKFTSCVPMFGGKKPGTPVSFTTTTGGHDIAELLLKVALSTTNHSIYLIIRVLYIVKH
jgi:hypothetical protein